MPHCPHCGRPIPRAPSPPEEALQEAEELLQEAGEMLRALERSNPAPRRFHTPPTHRSYVRGWLDGYRQGGADDAARIAKLLSIIAQLCYSHDPGSLDEYLEGADK